MVIKRKASLYNRWVIDHIPPEQQINFIIKTNNIELVNI